MLQIFNMQSKCLIFYHMQKNIKNILKLIKKHETEINEEQTKTIILFSFQGNIGFVVCMHIVRCGGTDTNSVETG